MSQEAGRHRTPGVPAPDRRCPASGLRAVASHASVQSCGPGAAPTLVEGVGAQEEGWLRGRSTTVYTQPRALSESLLAASSFCGDN